MNLQQVPSKVTMVHRATGTNVNYRYCFEADPGWLICSADFSGQELAVMAAMSDDTGMCEVLNTGGDLHGEAASGMFNVPLDRVRDLIPGGNGQTYRDRGKIVMFSLAYGKSAKGFAEDWGIPEKEARDLIRGFEKKFPKLTRWLKYHGDLAVAQGYSRLSNGAMRFVADLGVRDKEASYRAGMNFQIQGLSSWMTRLAMIKLDDQIQSQKLPMQLIACIHDELLVTFDENYKDICEKIIGDCMREAGETFLKGKVPAGFSLATAKHWAH